MKTHLGFSWCHPAWMTVSMLAWQQCQSPVAANPTGGTVASGTATFNTAGGQLTIKTSDHAYINWQSFNIGVGENTTFVQPAATSVVWNQINSGSPSQILGTLNANGFVVLQNQSGIYIGGQGSINTHGLLLTTAPPSGAMPALFSSDNWTFNALPPTAKIINYGQINLTGGGSAFLIANDIENHGTITAPGGKIGLYAGEQVLVSTRPDGRGLSAKVTLPQGSVDNQGRLIADAGSIAAQAKMVNQNGLVEADSVREVNGTIELLASDSLTLGSSSVLAAHGDVSGLSAGGSVKVKSNNVFSDQSGSTIDISGGAQGGNAGQLEISAGQLGPIKSHVSSRASVGYAGGSVLLDPADITLDGAYASSINDLISGGAATIDIAADNNIEVTTAWSLGQPPGPGVLNLKAGNNITLDDGSGIYIDDPTYKWTINLTAGLALPAGSLPTAGLRNNGIYLDGEAFLYTQSGDINLTAANEILINGGNGGQVATFGGGNITASALYGNVNTGNNPHGYLFGQANNSAPNYYSVDYFLGGISTAAGGNVTISAGGDVTSFLPVQTGNSQDNLNAIYDGGAGAFGPARGDVTITAGGNVYGHYVVANGTGRITAGGNAGAPLSVVTGDQTKGFALSLIKGSWSVATPHGNIYLQDVRNPNGIFGETPQLVAANYAGYHAFDYDPQAALSLDAAGSVEFTGYEAPHTAPNSGLFIPFILPPILEVSAGAGGFILDTSLVDNFPVPEPVILFPSLYQKLTIATHNGGNFGIPDAQNAYTSPAVTLEMSRSASTRWVDNNSFVSGDQAATLVPPLDTSLVNINIDGSMNAVNLYLDKAASLKVGGNMVNCGFVGVNLAASDTTSINVSGNIYESPLYSFVPLTTTIASANPLQPDAWDSVFTLALDPSMVARINSFNVYKEAGGLAGLANYLKLNNYLLFPNVGSTTTYGYNPGFVYDAATKQLGFNGPMASRFSTFFPKANPDTLISDLANGQFTVLKADSLGNPLIDANGHLETTTYTFSAAPQINRLYLDSLNSADTSGLGLQIGGPGHFTVHASSIDLGGTAGIGSAGFGRSGLTAGASGFNYSFLSSLLPNAAEGGADVTVRADNKLTMATSGIYSRDGGDVTVSAGLIYQPDGTYTVNSGGEIDLSQGSFIFPTDDCYGIYTSGHSAVNVTASGNINVGSARIATFNGGDVTVESLNGTVSAGSGANIALSVYGFNLDASGKPRFIEFGNLNDVPSLRTDPAPYGSGILAEYPIAKYQTPGGRGQPGDIYVTAHNGNISASVGGISQFALDQSIGGGSSASPSINLVAGQHGVKATDDQGNINLGSGGAVGVNINIDAPVVTGLVVSRESANITAAQSFVGTVLAGGSANFAGGGSVAGTVVGIGGISVAGGAAVTATLLSQNVSVGAGGVESTLGTSASATSASQSAAGAASSDTRQAVASTDNSADDDKKKKKKNQPLMQHTKRVTVLLSKN